MGYVFVAALVWLLFGLGPWAAAVTITVVGAAAVWLGRDAA